MGGRPRPIQQSLRPTRHRDASIGPQHVLRQASAAQIGLARAVPTTFGQFAAASGCTTYIFNHSGSGPGTFNSVGRVNSNFQAGGVPGNSLKQDFPIGFQLATPTRSSTTAGVSTGPGPRDAGVSFDQPLTGSAVIIRRVSDGALLLDVVADRAVITRRIGGSAGDMETSSPTDQMTFTSGFVDFSQASTLSRSISFTSVDFAFAIAPNGILQSFIDASNGTFAADFPAVDLSEPASTALLGAGALRLALGQTHRRTADCV